MNRFTHCLIALSIGLFSGAALASPPSYMMTHNKTDVESNAYIGGSIASPNPSKPNADNRVPWIVVQIACHGRSNGKICPATIKMATNTNNPITLGDVQLSTDTGLITPSQLTANGYTLTVNGPGEVTLTKN